MWYIDNMLIRDFIVNEYLGWEEDTVKFVKIWREMQKSHRKEGVHPLDKLYFIPKKPIKIKP